MTDQDAAENKALTAANNISEQVGHLYLEAHSEGMRQGMECAALLCQGFIDASESNLELDSAVRDLIVQVASGIRDQIRLGALQMPEPEFPTPIGDETDG